ncbi:unnamed protein product [Brassica oleracea var. botrytis]|uniref:Uncharacterized protein n=2 Tax=Brassica TaxID=3705 RepID=A0A3P6BNF3_BRAOL|nr:unnamed protein product [Brassica napus]CDY24137.1 BnaC03g57400D [Brassica napus]VDC97418.1 unnamed protein product [Brassica oleracea]
MFFSKIKFHIYVFISVSEISFAKLRRRSVTAWDHIFSDHIFSDYYSDDFQEVFYDNSALPMCLRWLFVIVCRP